MPPSRVGRRRARAVEPTLPIRPAPDSAPPSPVEVLRDRPAHRTEDARFAEPLLMDTDQAAASCAVSPASWYRLKAAGKTPAPVRLGGKVLYRVEDLKLFVALGCPDRKTFEARKAVHGRG